MNLVKRFWWILILVAVALLWWMYRPKPTVAPETERQALTSLEIEIDGGFAYVVTQPENRLEIAFLADTNVAGCKIDQLGTDLMILAGTLVEPAAPPPGGKFDLEGAVVTFPGLEASHPALVAPRAPGRPNPNRPADPNNPSQWEPLQFVANITTEFPASSLNPAWRSMVNGRLVLPGGTLKGLQPSDVIVNNGLFEFRRSGKAVFQQAMTDKTHYSVEVPRDRIELLLAGAKSGITRIIITPPSANEPVVLSLMGRHAQETPASLPIGSPVEDFCSYYQLLQPVPPQSEWLMPFYIGPPGGAGPGAGNPGPFCPPSWFP
jgi:hypothetical protein